MTAFVGGLGTGGTLMGNGRRLKEHDPDTKIVAAEPMQGELVQGLRSLDDGFIPPIIDLTLLDRKIMVSNRDAIIWTRKLLHEEGMFAGVSTGAIASSRIGSPGSSMRATSSSSSPTTAGSTSPAASTPSRSRSSRRSTPPSGGSGPYRPRDERSSRTRMRKKLKRKRPSAPVTSMVLAWGICEKAPPSAIRSLPQRSRPSLAVPGISR